jgi:hypothetical protein
MGGQAEPASGEVEMPAGVGERGSLLSADVRTM